jgi:hypothetical protein
MPDDVKRRILDHSAHIATAEPDDHNDDNFFAFAAQQRTKPDMASSLSTAFSELALTELTLNLINAETTVARSTDSETATPKKKKKKKGATKKLEPVEFTI